MSSKDKNTKPLLRNFFETDGPLYILILLALTERFLYMYQLGSQTFFIVSDSFNYYEAGLEFARTGALTYNGYPSALIMPGTTVLIGVIARIFPGEALVPALETVWIIMGSLTPIFIYKAVNLFTPKWCALLTVTVYLLPFHAEIDNFLLTETPYYLFFAMSLYYMFRMGVSTERKYVLRFGFSALGALMFRANIMLFLVFAAVYLIITGRYSPAELLRRAGTVCLIFALFLVPWTVRNYVRFHDFIPVTYGVANPVFEGTQQEGIYPIEDKIDWEVPLRAYAEKYADYLDEEGRPLERDMGQYLEHMRIKELADYRLGEWIRQEPLHFIKTMLVTKPRIILNWVWYYVEFLGVKYETLHLLRALGMLLCGFSLVLSFAVKRYRRVMGFLAAAYYINLVFIASGLAIDRYAQMIMPYRYIMAGIGIYLAWDTIRRICEKRKNMEQESET